MLRISDLCKVYNISRSTLLYYDSIGLLKPAKRTDANYRLYSEGDSLRLKRILNFRKAGIPLEEIKHLLEDEKVEAYEVLVDRFNQINNEVQNLKEQQNYIASMLKNNDCLRTSELINMSTWMMLMSSSGFDESQSRKWHMIFEQISPSEHTIFLEILGLSKGEINEIKTWSKGNLGNFLNDAEELKDPSWISPEI